MSYEFLCTCHPALDAGSNHIVSLGRDAILASRKLKRKGRKDNREARKVFSKCLCFTNNPPWRIIPAPHQVRGKLRRNPINF